VTPTASMSVSAIQSSRRMSGPLPLTTAWTPPLV
jgi:hypothetical protein